MKQKIEDMLAAMVAAFGGASQYSPADVGRAIAGQIRNNGWEASRFDEIVMEAAVQMMDGVEAADAADAERKTVALAFEIRGGASGHDADRLARAGFRLGQNLHEREHTTAEARAANEIRSYLLSRGLLDTSGPWETLKK